MALPVYAMSCFQLPKSLLKKITSVMMEFWWKTKVDKKPIYWIAWERLCKPKSEGGLGFKDIARFNQSLLAKQAWRLLEKPNSLLTQVYKARYFSNSSILDCGVGSKPSFAWRSIVYGRDLLKKGLFRLIGDGRDTFVWTDKWLPLPSLRAPFYPNGILNVSLRVADLICPATRSWKMDILDHLFTREDKATILSIKLACNRPDKEVWWHTKNGKYTAQSGYMLSSSGLNSTNVQHVMDQPSLNVLMSEIWRIETLPKIKHFLWKCVNGAIAERLRSRSLPVSSLCSLCREAKETVNHVLFDCAGAKQVWQVAGLSSSNPSFFNQSIYANIYNLISLSRDKGFSDFTKLPWPWIVWNIWKGRNDKIFTGAAFDVDRIIHKARSECFAWFEARRPQCDLPSPNGVSSVSSGGRWSPPPPEVLMCNVGMSWKPSLEYTGSSWILRNNLGEVLFHGRSAIDASSSRFHIAIGNLLWVVQSVFFLGRRKIIFSVEASVVYVSPSGNKCATAIATSVVRDGRVQSYIARFAPSWLASELLLDSMS